MEETTVVQEAQGYSSLPRNPFRAAVGAMRRGSTWLYRETLYWTRLFRYTSRHFLRIEAFLALVGAFAFFGVIFTQNRVGNLHEFLEYSYIYFSIVMALLAMNLLPRERDEETLEILWSQPMSRSGLIVLQLLTLTVWIFILCGIVTLFFMRFSAYRESLWPFFVLILSTSFCVGALTVLVSTYCRHAIATGLVTLLILGVHYYWLRQLGPIEVFYNPILTPGQMDALSMKMSMGRGMGMGPGGPGGPGFGGGGGQPGNVNAFDLIFNRIVVLFLIGFIMDYLFRRLRRTSEWFT